MYSLKMDGYPGADGNKLKIIGFKSVGLSSNIQHLSLKNLQKKGNRSWQEDELGLST